MGLLENAYIKNANGEVDFRYNPYSSNDNSIPFATYERSDENSMSLPNPALTMPDFSVSTCFTYALYTDLNIQESGNLNAIIPEIKCAANSNITLPEITLGVSAKDAAQAALKLMFRK